MSKQKDELKSDQLKNVDGGKPPMFTTDIDSDKNVGPLQPFPVVKGLKDEELKNAQGGTLNERTLYCLNQLVKAAGAKFKSWVQPSYSSLERYQMALVFVEEVYDCLDNAGKCCIDEYKTEYPAQWEEIINQISSIN